MFQLTNIYTSVLLISFFVGLTNSIPLYGEIESDLDTTTRQSIAKANQILASINRDVDLCLNNNVACSLKSYDDSDDQTFDGSQSASKYSKSGVNGNIDSTNYTDVDETTNESNVTLPPPTSSPSVSVSMYGPVPPIKIIVSPSSDQKFGHVLDDLDSLEVHVESAIANFTTNRRFTYTAMLKPMLKHIHQLKNNLSLLRNRLIGVAAMTNIASQVNELTDHISDALVGGSDVPLDDTPSDVSTSKQTPPTPSSTSITTTTTTTTTTTKAESTSTPPLTSSLSPSSSPSPSSSSSPSPSSPPPSSSSPSIATTTVPLDETPTKSPLIAEVEDNSVDETESITSTIRTI